MIQLESSAASTPTDDQVSVSAGPSSLGRDARKKYAAELELGYKDAKAKAGLSDEYNISISAEDIVVREIDSHSTIGERVWIVTSCISASRATIEVQSSQEVEAEVKMLEKIEGFEGRVSLDRENSSSKVFKVDNPSLCIEGKLTKKRGVFSGKYYKPFTAESGEAPLKKLCLGDSSGDTQPKFMVLDANEPPVTSLSLEGTLADPRLVVTTTVSTVPKSFSPDNRGRFKLQRVPIGSFPYRKRLRKVIAVDLRGQYENGCVTFTEGYEPKMFYPGYRVREF